MPQLFTSSNPPGGGIPLYSGNHVAGFIMPSGEFFKRVSASSHLNRKLNGYGANNEVLAQLESSHVERVRFHDSESGVNFFTTVSVIRQYGKPFYHRSFGLQTILPLRYWQRCLPDGTTIVPDPALFNLEPSQAPSAAQQLSLFEGA